MCQIFVCLPQVSQTFMQTGSSSGEARLSTNISAMPTYEILENQFVGDSFFFERTTLDECVSIDIAEIQGYVPGRS